MPADRRLDRHPIGVALGLPHRVLGAVAADLENADVGFGGAPLQVVGLFSCFSLACASSSASVFFSAWIFGSISFFTHLELRALWPLSACISSLSSARRAASSSACLLPDLLLEIVELDPPVERVLHLILPVELDEQVALCAPCCPARTSVVMTRDCCSARRAAAWKWWWLRPLRRSRRVGPIREVAPGLPSSWIRVAAAPEPTTGRGERSVSGGDRRERARQPPPANEVAVGWRTYKLGISDGRESLNSWSFLHAEL